MIFLTALLYVILCVLLIAGIIVFGPIILALAVAATVVLLPIYAIAKLILFLTKK